MAKICVLGLGYIGFPTGLLLASHGHEVVGVDVNKSVVETLQAGKLHIVEPGLDELFASAKDSFSASTEVCDADVFLIAVPTPFDKDTRLSDLSYVKSAAEMIVPHLKAGNLVILESTVSPCASEKVVIPILEKSGIKAGSSCTPTAQSVQSRERRSMRWSIMTELSAVLTRSPVRLPATSTNPM